MSEELMHNWIAKHTQAYAFAWRYHYCSSSSCLQHALNSVVQTRLGQNNYQRRWKRREQNLLQICWYVWVFVLFVTKIFYYYFALFFAITFIINDSSAGLFLKQQVRYFVILVIPLRGKCNSIYIHALRN